ncbi:hypothetical protein Pcinc_024965 [Petrolisthes cinctipes]|uniref:Uncharacterized protein n=1 Tax=Petrolisthes cinctipes TaxID=88211 RepID=A0AAE1KCQ3_PETCI|nr:hypothetical protein Pcinc_024965 [Petrolisthes cinctipes]
MKRDLQLIQSTEQASSDKEKIERRKLQRRSMMVSEECRVYTKVCIICEKDKFMPGSRTRERLTQCVELRSDDTFRNTAISKQDNRILALLSMDLVAAEGQYHRSCYRSYTKTRPQMIPKETDSEEYPGVVKDSFEKLFAYIREYVFENPRVIKLTELTTKLTSWMLDGGIHMVKDSTKKHVRRNLETEFGVSLQFVHDAKGKVLVYPDNLPRDELVKQNVFLMDTVQDLESKGDIEGLLKKSGNLKGFLQHLIAEPQDEASLSPRIQHLIESVGQDIVHGVTRGQLKPPKHLMLPYAIKTLTGSVELIRMIFRLGHCVSYTQVEELESAVCIQKLESHTDESVPMPEQIQPLIPTTLAWDRVGINPEWGWYISSSKWHCSATYSVWTTSS